MKQIKVIKQIAIIVVCILLLYFTVDIGGCNPKDLKQEIEVLHVQNDSLEGVIVQQDHSIIEMNIRDVELSEQLQEAKEKVKVVKVVVEKEVEVVKKYDSLELVKFYAKRYPEQFKIIDTLVPLNKGVLVTVASNLVEYDGAKKVIQLQDSSIALQEQKLQIKDTIIYTMKEKENNYKSLVSNKNKEIVNLNEINRSLEKDNKKLKNKVKVAKIVGAIVLGGLTYSLLAK